MLGFINTELHKTYSPLFNPDTSEDVRAGRKAYLLKRYQLIEDVLTTQPWLLGDHFTAADAYLFTITNWAAYVDVDLSAFPALLAFQKAVAQRPAVQKAMLDEGLIKAAA
jgi:glutathione S-transferase